MLGTYDEVLGACSARPVDELDAPLRASLRIGVHQLLGMRVPSHAAVTTTVDLARATAGHRVAGYANAVMRKVATHDKEDWLTALAPSYDEDPIGNLAVVHGHPRWIVEVYYEALGRDVDEPAAACAADNVSPAVHLVARPGRCTQDELLLAAGKTARPGEWSPYAVYLDGGDPGQLSAVRSGAAGVQDEGSQLVAIAAAEAEVDVDQRWLDVCAGPGGKAALLAALAAPRGAVLVAADVAPHRARLARQTIDRSAPAVVVAADGRVPAWPTDHFDRVLVDAPCTGLGALRRRPDSRWRRSRDDATRLQDLQLALLDAAANSAREDGVVTYVTCSPDPRETADVVAETLRRRDDLAPVPVAEMLAGIPGTELSLGR